MNKQNVMHLAMFGITGLAFGSLSPAALAVTADDVVCNGCVQSSDIANGTVNGVDLASDILLGKNNAGGRLRVRTTVNSNAVIFEADGRTAGAGAVRVGRGGSATTNENTDLFVIDPDFSSNETEPVLQMDASVGSLTLGSGSSVTPGEGGEVFVENGSGATNVWLYGTGQAFLGSFGTSGSLSLDNGTGSWSSIVLSGSSGNLTNQFGGNGLVKAWARINANGTVASCYRCNAAAAETQSLGTGFYEVDFTPVGTDISSRPWSCSLGTGAVFGAIGQIGCVQRSGDPSSLFVDIRGTTGLGADQAYTVVVY